VIAYFDSSSIVKWFFDEVHMDLARDARDRAEVCCTSLLAYVDVLSAINRAWRADRCLKSEMEIVRGEFQRIWPDFIWIRVDERLMYQSGQIILGHGLKGFDAIHLASAILLKEEIGERQEILFSCFDKSLNLAARKEGFMIHQIPSQPTLS
jgi:predicted nucleic acid-binding protein